MQPRIPRKELSKLFTYVAAACLLLTCSPTQPSLFANAVEPPTVAEQEHLSQPELPLLRDIDPVALDDVSPGEEQSGGYAPDFAYFARSLLGRQADEVGQLKNNEKLEKDIAPENTVYFVLQKSLLHARGNAEDFSNALDAMSSKDKLQEEGISTHEALDSENAGNALQTRQQPTETVWVSANTCNQPMPGNNASSTGAPQLMLYVSTSAENQRPGPASTENLATNSTGIPFDNGYVSFELNTTSDVYIGISAPKLNANWFGSWHFEIAASTLGSYHSYNRTNPFLFMVDTDSESTLFITYSLADSSEEKDIAKWNNSNPFAMYAFPAGRSPVTGMENSVCALKQQFNSTNNITVDTMITTKFGSGFPKSQFNVHNLSNAQTYNGYLVVEGNQDTVDLPGVGRVHAGGKVFQQFNWTTKADDSCQVLTDLDFCDTVAYAVPSSPEFKYNDDKLKALYDDQAKEYYKNFTNSLDQTACDAPSTAQYSLARNCTNCREDYKAWLCSVLIPRCEDWTAQEEWLQPRNINANLSDGTIPFASNMTAEFNATMRDRFGYSKSRNPMIDTYIKPGPYKEMLPCEDLCFDIVRSCPAQLEFACPNYPARALQYGTRDPTGDVLTCSFPGAVVKLNVQSSASFSSVASGGVTLVASSIMALIVASW
ncbi:calcium channel subunit Mid1 [Boeremia exigua]|uniref:calcium channel subunit Mid1 n=1 Tax=Boeremia exigua TaxID=749465 RepID=UPI001E8E990B|nr:calcium channel subunit Mid1 [Boeremia exigua]KAH6642405.1 calcium channel subunit Mid1 [Boeremia exigua]